VGDEESKTLQRGREEGMRSAGGALIGKGRTPKGIVETIFSEHLDREKLYSAAGGRKSKKVQRNPNRLKEAGRFDNDTQARALTTDAVLVPASKSESQEGRGEKRGALRTVAQGPAIANVGS